MRTKAEFRATRERVGMTQALLADKMGVSQRSVRRWEHPDSPNMPPKEAWAIIDRAKALQDEVVAFGVAKVNEIVEERGVRPRSVRLSYWLTEGSYLRESTDAAHGIEGDWRMANANNMRVASVLESMGIAVEWVSGNASKV